MTKFSSFILICAPLMEAYYFPGTNISFWKIAIILICAIIFLINPKTKGYKWPTNYKMFFWFGLLSSIIGALYFQTISIIYSSLIVNLIYVAALLLIVPNANIHYCKKYYGFTILISCSIFIIQEIMYYSLGYRISGIIPFLNIPYDGTTTADFIKHQELFNRSSSIFLEPAHFAQYCSGYLAIQLGENCRKHKLFSLIAILLTIVMFLSVSGNAILLLIIAWSSFIIIYYKQSIIKFVAVVPIVTIIGFAVFNYVSNTEQGQRLLERTEEIEYNKSDRISSGTMRIYRGYFVYNDMPLILKLFGAGSAGTDNAIERSKHFWMFDNDRYVNNIQKILIGTGLIGFILFMIYTFKQIRRTTSEGKILMLLFISISLIEYCWLFPKMLLFCGLAWLYQIEKQKITQN